MDHRNDPKYRAKLERLVWKHTHNDFKGKWEDGTKHVLHNGGAKGTISVPVSSFTVEELFSKLPRRVQDELSK